MRIVEDMSTPNPPPPLAPTVLAALRPFLNGSQPTADVPIEALQRVVHLVEHLDREAHELRTERANRLADADRVIAWIRTPARRAAVASFTAGPERQVAYAVEDTLAGIHEAPPAETLPYSRILETALEAFWAEVAARFPTAKCGDLAPEVAFAFEGAARAAVNAWLRNLAPGTIFRSEDGYRFTLMGDGSLSDGDMTFASINEFADDMDFAVFPAEGSSS